ncbi:TetR/AcrR family transcriptional regulator [Homoserinibacter sp. GY 40078]|uniref:TetR/AcrR family transcriptional regulator n=1 Tax=Homoserinibacter sp. GY 40078 TaxID=2603275 RepID=UPI0016506A56|nr:TetR/AcrR family transcriptional regulator [Homoserinibacter sp. GY 40078]
MIDPPTLAWHALQVFLEKGFEATTWKDLAEASGVSTRSLMRHFSSKTDLVRIGIEPAWQLFAHKLAEMDDDNLMAALRRAVAEGLEAAYRDPDVGINWVRLVARDARLMSEIQSTSAPWVRAVAQKIADSRPDLPPAICRALAAAYDSAVFAALMEWSVDEIGTPAEAVDKMLRWLDVRIPDAEELARRERLEDASGA